MEYGYVILQFWMVSHANVGELIVFLDDTSRQLTAMKILAECLGKGTVLFVRGIFGMLCLICNTPWVWVFILIFIHRLMRALHSTNILLEHSPEILGRRLCNVSALWTPSLMQSIDSTSCTFHHVCNLLLLQFTKSLSHQECILLLEDYILGHRSHVHIWPLSQT